MGKIFDPLPLGAGRIVPCDDGEQSILAAFQEEEKHWGIIEDQYAIQPILGGNGRILVKVDDYTSTRDCYLCKGKGHTGEVCTECKGNGHYRGKLNNEDRCTTCYILRDKSQTGSIGAYIDLRGHQPCTVCSGLGTSSIVVPDDTKDKPTMGEVLAVSKEGINEIRVGEKVIFTNYSGSEFKFVGVTLRIIIEKDLLGKVKKLKSNVPSIKQESFADLENTGTPRE